MYRQFGTNSQPSEHCKNINDLAILKKKPSELIIERVI